MDLAHDDGRGGRAETFHHLLYPSRTGLADPTAMPITVNAAESTGMPSFAGTDDANVPVARFLAIDGTIELHLEADKAVGFVGHDCPISFSALIIAGDLAMARTISASEKPRLR